MFFQKISFDAMAILKARILTELNSTDTHCGFIGGHEKPHIVVSKITNIPVRTFMRICETVGMKLVTLAMFGMKMPQADAEVFLAVADPHTLGVMDFAGGIVIHATSGVAALTISMMLEKRKGV